ncbi:amino acid permease [Enterobacillus tribolii]|uniref:Aromatic amino acid transport protein AroP n=1 Tax=Enterobacillus tribolii TaxID=1487935 RepID=A0A370R1R8_9GAMM|nr:amino acid permease [Enterobacillus tribolii]MBW7983026.1 amino acid permease [Enterobacillus tribolii]RDK95870.1 aromatic amino acid:proton symporter (AAT family) [Enterobacillus tribolii]
MSDRQQHDQPHQEQLKRGLKNRHIQLIALGGAIGTGLFLGIAQTIKMAGPSVILGYAIGGFIAFLIMRQLGEMVVEEPVAGSFSHFAYKYWGNFAGFASGWNYWVLYVLVSMAELTAVGIYVQYWWPEIPTWVSAAVFFLAINAINLANVKIYGEMEFWFSIIKVAAIIGMIVFGAWLLASGSGGPESTVTNLWAQGGFFPNGISGLVMAMAVIMFSFGGLELVGITAAEAENPEKSIPKATNQVIYRILIFYIGSLSILLSLYPWGKVVEGGSPFVMIFHELDSNVVATILNIVVLTAALSVYNSGVYCNSRMLFGLARQGNGPKALLKVDRRGVPVVAIGVSALATALCVVINYLMPGKAFELLMSLVVSALVINWAMISLAHLRFRAAKNREGVTPKFRALWYPLGNYLCLLFMCGILIIMYMTPGIRISVELIPVWLIILGIGYWVKQQASRGVGVSSSQ